MARRDARNDLVMADEEKLKSLGGFQFPAQNPNSKWRQVLLIGVGRVYGCDVDVSSMRSQEANMTSLHLAEKVMVQEAWNSVQEIGQHKRQSS